MWTKSFNVITLLSQPLFWIFFPKLFLNPSFSIFLLLINRHFSIFCVHLLSKDTFGFYRESIYYPIYSNPCILWLKWRKFLISCYVKESDIYFIYLTPNALIFLKINPYQWNITSVLMKAFYFLFFFPYEKGTTIAIL